MIIECMVAILLVVTIAYCMTLNRRLKVLKSDELSLRATISELVTATEIAERAIAGLKETVREGDATLGERLRATERATIGLDLQIAAGKDTLARVQKIVNAARTHEDMLTAQRESAELREPERLPPRPLPPRPIPPLPAQPQDAKLVAAAAHAFADRLRSRFHGLAA
jgi:hypothetical protein